MLFVSPFYDPESSGAARYVAAMAERFAAEGWEVTICATDAAEPQYFWDKGGKRVDTPVESQNGVTIYRIPIRHLPSGALAYHGIRRAMTWLGRAPFDSTRVLRRLCRLTPWVPDFRKWLLESDDYNVVHGTTLPYDSLACTTQWYAEGRGVPFVFTPFTHLGEDEDSEVRVHYTLPHQIEVSTRSARVVAQTSIERDYLISRGVPGQRIEVIGPGIDASDLAGGSAEKFRRRHRIEGAIVFYVGVQAYDKGTVHVIDAMSTLWERGSDATLVLAGAQTSEFREHYDSLPRAVRGRCLALGPIEEKEKLDLLAAGDLFVMPSRTDSFGIAYLEAWLYRNPVIGALAGGVPDVISDGRDGLLVPFGDTLQLAAAIERLLRDKELAGRLGQAGYEKTISQHTWDQKYALMRDLCEGLLS